MTEKTIGAGHRLLRSGLTGALHRLKAPTLLRTTEVAMRGMLGIILAGAPLFGGGYAPFGLCLVGCSGSGLDGFVALLGVSLGYLAFHGLALGLRYVATALLIYAVSFAFYDIHLYRTPWFMPVVALLMNGATGFVYLSGVGWTAPITIFFLTELIFTASGVYFYRLAFTSRPTSQEAVIQPQTLFSLLFLGATLLMALSTATLVEGALSVGRVLAGLGVLLLASQGGVGIGAAAGVTAGLALDISTGGLGASTLLYGLSGLVTGTCRGLKKTPCALVFLLISGTVSLWGWVDGMGMTALYQSLAAAVLFLLLPDTTLAQVYRYLHPNPPADVTQGKLRQVERTLSHTAASFQHLYDSLRLAFQIDRTNDNDAATIFDRTAQKVCHDCALRDACWQRDYHGTFNALNSALPKMMARGRSEPEDFPGHFASRCLKLPQFISAANGELTALLYRRQFRARLRESRNTVCQQYGQLADLLQTAAQQLEDDLRPHTQGERQVIHFLEELGVEARVWVYYDSRNRLQMELEGVDLTPVDQGDSLQCLEELLRCPLRMIQRNIEGGQVRALSYVQSEPLVAALGVACQKKEGEVVSGDGQAWFKTADGYLYLLLCDGMGSGNGAHRDSVLAIGLLERFLKAGVPPEPALRTLNSALALRSEEEGGFTTVDLLQLDLFTGDGTLFKCGAAPSYLKKGGTVSRITGTALPAGLTLQGGRGADVSPLKLAVGDVLVMVSDGVSDGSEDDWLRQALGAHTGASPKALARTLLAGAQNQADDRTALVVQLEERAIVSEK